MPTVGRESDPAPADKGRIKGVALRGFLSWYGANVHRERVVRAVQLAEQSFSEHFDVAQPGFGVLSSRWYRAEVVHGILDEITRHHAPSELTRLAEDGAQAVMNDLLKGVYRSIIGLFVTPDRYSRHGEKLWALNYDNGRPVFRSLAATEQHVTYRDWRSHHALVCRINMATALTLYTAMGCKDVRYRRLSCVSDGAAVCATSIHWK
jgi:hypothetical protein